LKLTNLLWASLPQSSFRVLGEVIAFVLSCWDKANSFRVLNLGKAPLASVHEFETTRKQSIPTIYANICITLCIDVW
jgi:hypothetical protein